MLLLGYKAIVILTRYFVNVSSCKNILVLLKLLKPFIVSEIREFTCHSFSVTHCETAVDLFAVLDEQEQEDQEDNVDDDCCLA